MYKTTEVKFNGIRALLSSATYIKHNRGISRVIAYDPDVDELYLEVPDDDWPWHQEGDTIENASENVNPCNIWVATRIMKE